MAITYTWEFPQFNCYPTKDSKTDVVFNVGWRYTGTEGEYRYVEYGTAPIPTDDLSSFIAYDSLTKADVEGWMTTALDIDAIKSRLSTLIANQKNPSEISKDPPWS